MESIPILDFKEITNLHLKGNFQGWKELAMKIRQANAEIGFFQIINHSIPSTIVEKVFKQSKSFFDLRKDVKLKYKKPPTASMDSWYGYTGLGVETFEDRQIVELRETYDWIEGKGVYPDLEVPLFNPSIHELNGHCKILATQVYKLWAIALGFDDENFFISKNKHGTDNNESSLLTNIRLAYYPPIPEDEEIPPGTVRIAEHTDFASLTFVFQDQTGGLEVKNVDGKWVQALPVPGAIVCNTGDLLEFWTSGLFLATPHRVLVPEKPEIRIQPRYSVTYFSGPDQKELITPLNIKLSEEEENRIVKRGKLYSAEPIVAIDHVLKRLKDIYK